MRLLTQSTKHMSLSTRARTEAFAGLVILLIGLTIFTFRRCPAQLSANHRAVGLPIRIGPGQLASSIGYGNARDDGKAGKGWFFGHFIAEGSPKHSGDVETKWVSHPAGRQHDGWVMNKVATTMAILISGKHRLEFNGSHVILENQGDYVVWGPGVAHSWTALEDSTLLCVRWPSLPGDQSAVHSLNNMAIGSKGASELGDGQKSRKNLNATTEDVGSSSLEVRSSGLDKGRSENLSLTGKRDD